MAQNNKGRPLEDNAGISALFEAAHGKANTWTLSPEIVHLVARSAEEQLLQDGVPRSSMEGTVVTILSAGPSKGYSYSVIGSKVKLRRSREGWRVLDVRRVTRFPAQRQRVTVFVKQKAWQIMLSKLSARYVVLEPEMSLPPTATTEDRAF